MNQKGGTRTDTIVKLALVFFISLLSFFVGTYVGKQVSDSEKRQAALEQEYSGTRKVASVTGEEITDADVDKLAQEFVDGNAPAEEHHGNESAHGESANRGVASHDEQSAHGEDSKHQENASAQHEDPHAKKESAQGDKHAKKEGSSHGEKQVEAKEGYKKVDASEAKGSHGEKKSAHHEDPHAKKEGAKTAAEGHQSKEHHEEVATAAARVANDQAPAKDLPKKREPQSALPNLSATSAGQFTVQVASYSSEEEAKQHAERLKSSGLTDAFYIAAHVNGHVWYRVSVGLFATHKSANSFRKQIVKKNIVSAAIVQKVIR